MEDPEGGSGTDLACTTNVTPLGSHEVRSRGIDNHEIDACESTHIIRGARGARVRNIRSGARAEASELHDQRHARVKDGRLHAAGGKVCPLSGQSERYEPVRTLPERPGQRAGRDDKDGPNRVP